MLVRGVPWGILCDVSHVISFNVGPPVAIFSVLIGAVGAVLGVSGWWRHISKK